MGYSGGELSGGIHESRILARVTADKCVCVMRRKNSPRRAFRRICVLRFLSVFIFRF